VKRGDLVQHVKSDAVPRHGLVIECDGERWRDVEVDARLWRDERHAASTARFLVSGFSAPTVKLISRTPG